MKAAIVHGAGQAPVFGDFAEPQAGPGEQRIAVKASALSQLTRARASGTHYSSSGGFPFVAGVDGTGTLDDGRRVYFVLPRAPFGAMAEASVAAVAHCLALPDALDDVTAAAIANPGMSSWAALTERARFVAGETVLINGATGASGQLAVQIARHMGAARIIATGRNRDVLAGLGADATIVLGDDGAALDAAFAAEFAQGVDVVLDYLWGPSAERMLVAAAKHGAEAVPIRFVQIGTSSGADIRLPGAVLRASALELLGSGIGSVTLSGLLKAIAGVFAAGAAGKLSLASTSFPLADVEKVWRDTGDARAVFTTA
jgi:NADPH:quinone reductase-like Zn-dependent oxidoreductase